VFLPFGAEIDLVFDTPKGRHAIEINRALTPTTSQGLHSRPGLSI
jgi:hypothetical protein